CHHGYGILTF
nr:immunoglobulin light chain junction region [Macaca mulatta]